MEDNLINSSETNTTDPLKPIKKTKNSDTSYLSYIFTLFVVFSLYFIFSIFFGHVILTPISVTGPSMYPTLNKSAKGYDYSSNTDIVYINKSKNVKRGDIVVFDSSDLGVNDYFNFSEDESTFFIKRVIALPGDTIQFRAKTKDVSTNNSMAFDLYVNGNYVEEPYASEILMTVASINLSKIPNIDIYNKLISETVITVPNDSIFVMGDNRSRSTDSREFGFVNKKSIIGVVKIHIPYGNNLLEAIYHSIKENYLF